MEQGSKKALIDLVNSNQFLSKINSIVTPFAIVTDKDEWAPKKGANNEVELRTFLKSNFDSSENLSTGIKEWWLDSKGSTPNWDFISTCTIDGKRGILLVEAKGHEEELHIESAGKTKPKEGASNDSIANHAKIGEAIMEARSKINTNNSEFNIEISRDNCYQLSNRIAHSWWLSNHDIPVVLVYLGFLDCKYERPQKMFQTPEDWEKCFATHAKQVNINNIFLDKKINCGKSNFRLICKSIKA